MFRKVAIALVAATVLTAPVLAQDVAPATGKVSQPTTAPAPTVKTDKAIAKHRMVVRHHGTKMVKHTNHEKYARHMKRAKVHQAVVKAPTKPVATTNGAATAPASAKVTTKPAAKSGTN